MRRGCWWAAGIAAWVASPGCGSIGCDVEGEARAIAGGDAFLCADGACAANAFENGEPFYVFVEREQGTDSVIERWHVSDGARVWVLSQDDYGPGKGDVDARECTGPLVSDGEIRCSGQAPANNHYQVCGSSSGQHPAPLPFPG
jgi:hypothetical protein